jgi:hypothetical protein
MITVITDAGRFEYPDGTTYEIHPVHGKLTIRDAAGRVVVIYPNRASYKRLISGTENTLGPLVL